MGDDDRAMRGAFRIRHPCLPSFIHQRALRPQMAAGLRVRGGTEGQPSQRARRGRHQIGHPAQHHPPQKEQPHSSREPRQTRRPAGTACRHRAAGIRAAFPFPDLIELFGRFRLEIPIHHFIKQAFLGAGDDLQRRLRRVRLRDLHAGFFQQSDLPRKTGGAPVQLLQVAQRLQQNDPQRQQRSGHPEKRLHPVVAEEAQPLRGPLAQREHRAAHRQRQHDIHENRGPARKLPAALFRPLLGCPIIGQLIFQAIPQPRFPPLRPGLFIPGVAVSYQGLEIRNAVEHAPRRQFGKHRRRDLAARHLRHQPRAGPGTLHPAPPHPPQRPDERQHRHQRGQRGHGGGEIQRPAQQPQQGHQHRGGLNQRHPPCPRPRQRSRPQGQIIHRGLNPGQGIARSDAGRLTKIRQPRWHWIGSALRWGDR